ncbi:MAG: hypothetical protein EBU68_02465 [Actinobacteria bacterium]|nr:hypothetical protein [Actinomycetota bacterium]NCU81133.1 hypothetical protein [Acidimicrobiia bacterium]NDC99588.1 hypothetical protein [bacterium]NBY62367.1 hypothetical protein [Actinomycetota bacterium]NCU86437.1 hypothetical protein [Actinomycetota bacterium]
MMFSTGFKYFFGVTVLSVVALIMSVALFEKLALVGVAISFLIAVGALLAGLAAFTSDGTTRDANTSTSELVTQSMWPLISAVGVVFLALGLVTSSIVFFGGIVVLLAALSEWMVQAWSERASTDLSHNTAARKRLLNPIEFPVLAAVGLGVVIFSFSRIMLTVNKSTGAVLFIVAGALVLVAGTLFAIKPNLKRSVGAAVCVLGALGIVAGGVAGAVSGERVELVEAAAEGHFSHAECGPEESKYFDKLAEGTLSLRSNVSAIVVYQDGELIANVQGINSPQKSITVARSNPTNIVFRNATEGEFRLVAHLGHSVASDKTAAGESQDKSHQDTTCTQLVAPGAEQSMTFSIAKPSSAENAYYLYIAGSEDKKIEMVVP